MVSSHVINMLHDSRANSIFRHWVFYIAVVITGVLFILCLPLSESRRSLPFEREVTKLRRTMPSSIFKTLNPDHMPDCKTLIRCTLIRPPAPTLHRTNNHPSSNQGLRILYRMVSLRRRPPDHVPRLLLVGNSSFAVIHSCIYWLSMRLLSENL